MKLNWFSPLPPARTGIAQYSADLLPELCTFADVTVWTPQERVDDVLPQQATLRHFTPEDIPWAEFNRADMSIFQMGNNPAFHTDIWRVARQHPGIVVLHDPSLHHFFEGFYRVNYSDSAPYIQIMQRYYGQEGAQAAARNYMLGGRQNDLLAARFPLTEHALKNALGVLVHNRQTVARIESSVTVPVAYAPLPFRVAHNEHLLDSNPPPHRLVIFGYLGSNRRIDVVLNALAGMAENTMFTLDIYGPLLANESALRHHLAFLGLRNVMFHGFVSDHVLSRGLARAQLAINLRYPSMGEASGSQLRIWSHGLPSLVSEVGWYASLPHDCVRRVRVDEQEISDIRKHLRDFLTDPNDFRRMGERGKRLLLAQHLPAGCAKTVLDLVHRASRAQVQLVTHRLLGRVASVTKSWAGDHEFNPGIPRISS